MSSPQIQTIPLGMVNSFLIPCKQGYLLVDSGYSQTYNQLLAYLHHNQIKLDEIKYLLLTHNHDDHCGGAANLRHNADIKIICHKNLVPFLENGSGSLDGAHPVSNGIRFLIKIIQTLSHPDYKYTSIMLNKDDIVLDNDNHEFLPSIGIPASIIFTPGHTNNSISIVFEGGDVICGDIAFNTPLFRLLGSGNRPIYIQDEATVYRSWQKIYQQGGRRLIPSHGKPFPISKILTTNEK